MKRFLSLFFALLLLCSCARGGNTEEKTESTNTDTSKVETEVATNTEEKTESNSTDTSKVETKTETKVETKVETKTVTMSISNNSQYDEGESTTADFSELLGKDGGIEIYGKNNLSFETPADGMMEVVLLIKNTNDFAVQLVQGSEYDVNSDNFSGSITNYCKDYTVIAHPNGSDYIIDANSEMTYIFDISLPNFNNQDDSLEGDLIFTYDFKFNNTTTQRVAADIVVKINSFVKYLGRTYRSIESNRNATIKGIVYDSNANPVSGAEITVYNSIDEGYDQIVTNDKGEFEIKVTAHKDEYTKLWHECILLFRHPSFDEQYVCVYPKTNQTNEATIVLNSPSKKLNYENTAVVDLGVQAYSYDTDANKNAIAFIPFHSSLNYDVIKDKLNLIYTDFDGNVLLKYRLNAETPWVCVSDDGKYMVTNQAVNEGDQDSTHTIILNNAGEVVYEKYFTGVANTDKGDATYILQSRCAQLSHDNKYLIIGSGEGDIWVIDWQNDTILWSAETHGQVRYILFNEDNSKVFISSGDGYMYGFDMKGNQLFKTYVGSWATCMELADNYLVYGLKTAWDSAGCIDVSTGERLWTCGNARPSGLAISKDKKYVWIGNDVSSSYSCLSNAVYDIKTGELAYVLNCSSAQQAAYSDDGKYLVVKNARALYVYETTNYSSVWEKTIVDGDGENTASINQTVAITADAGKIVAAFNNDPSERCFGQAYYFTLK